MRQLLQSVSALIVGRLTERQRRVVVALAINGESTDALASELDSTPGAIYKTLHDARGKLRRLLDSDAAPALERILPPVSALSEDQTKVPLWTCG